MATSTAFTASILGVDAYLVEVEADVSIGLGNFTIVGLPDSGIRESRDRITAALNNGAGGFPIRRVVVNLAPADLPKMGTGFDLPIALAVLEAAEKLSPGALSGRMLVGELSLEGRIRPVNGVLAMALAAKQAGISEIIVPKENAPSASLVEGLEVFAADHLGAVIQHVQGHALLPRTLPEPSVAQAALADDLDFADVKGQETAKRALEIAAAGRHNLVFCGPPGTGKSMLAKRLPGVLPEMSFEEAIEATKIHSVAGRLDPMKERLAHRPFQSPHHSVSGAGLIGGGTFPKPGEVSLAHHGVLFLDELPEYPRHILDLLRQPLEDRKITISRAKSSLMFPSDFLMVAAMNPCPCGYLGDPKKDCRCSPTQVAKYRGRISGPLMDRIDIQVEMPALSYEEINFSKKGEPSRQIRQRVEQARQIQLARFAQSPTRYNANMTHKEVERFCRLSSAGHQMLKMALERLRLSGRAHDSILKVARSIADLASAPDIGEVHLAEAVNYRNLDRQVQF
ncbi:MAG: hypothetical protein A2527_01630 [Candidatus Lambdaproteobacteria bacterium RIFOXYD2_FULL_50_16]|uniref:AAA+ ATPase domain-containing protein n=1 Tax=Candidatus Lambdaproteobacteria bacterium RIFOXYD2_FULL_50_16 TaxID=1817772 RepID=A0A1F6G5L3_9PROT|nr:MAG: hypothetical protein A2527_01630 [Candidatus Lambdaproteobacteria bacterium RIFOXYD2_FULL_50_16]